jgi:transcriptional regulator with XRE-family HTH domain
MDWITAPRAGASTQTAMSPPAAPRGSLAERLDHLFRIVRPASDREYTYEEVAAALRDRGGPTISATYVWQLRKGVRDNPTKRHLEALAEFFGVSPSYFFECAEPSGLVSGEPIELVVALQSTAVREILAGSVGLSAATLAAIAGIVARAREIERLPKVGGPTDAGSRV